MSKRPLVTLYGSHHPQPGTEEYEQSHALGKMLAQEGFQVGTGGYGGTMEAALKGAGGGIGFTAEIFKAPPNNYVIGTIASQTLFERIEKMIDMSAALICLKGGTGTLLELAATWEMVNKKMVPLKPIVCIGDFWKNVVNTLNFEKTVEGVNNLQKQMLSTTSYIRFVNTAEEATRYLREKLL